nr:MAG TPA: hypothetical protein [Caudoviricetes sp.]
MLSGLCCLNIHLTVTSKRVYVKIKHILFSRSAKITV